MGECHMWMCIANALLSCGHAVIIATSRTEECDNEDMAVYLNYIRSYLENSLPVVFCGSSPKRQACKEAGYLVDVWIDDMPETIGTAALINTEANS